MDTFVTYLDFSEDLMSKGIQGRENFTFFSRGYSEGTEGGK